MTITIELLLFVLSSGLFFQEQFRHQKIAILLAGCVALVSSYFLIEELVRRIVLQNMQANRTETNQPVSVTPATPHPFNIIPATPNSGREQTHPCVVFNGRTVCE